MESHAPARSQNGPPFEAAAFVGGVRARSHAQSANFCTPVPPTLLLRPLRSIQKPGLGASALKMSGIWGSLLILESLPSGSVSLWGECYT